MIMGYIMIMNDMTMDLREITLNELLIAEREADGEPFTCSVIQLFSVCHSDQNKFINKSQ